MLQRRQTALHTAADYKYLSVVKLLLDKGAGMKRKSYNRMLLVLQAAYRVPCCEATTGKRS